MNISADDNVEPARLQANREVREDISQLFDSSAAVPLHLRADGGNHFRLAGGA